MVLGLFFYVYLLCELFGPITFEMCSRRGNTSTELNERRGIPAIDDCTGMLLMGSGVAKTIAMACPF